MQTNLTDTQKFRAANEICKNIRGQNPAYGVQHWEEEKTNEKGTERTSVRDWLVCCYRRYVSHRVEVTMWFWILLIVGLILLIFFYPAGL